MMFSILRKKPTPAGKRKGAAKVLFVADKANWAYDAIAKALIKYNIDSDLILDIEYIKGGTRPLKDIHNNYDLVFMLGWQMLAALDNGRIKKHYSFLDVDRTLTGVHSHHAWDNKLTRPDNAISPPPQLADFLGEYRGVNVVSRRLYELFMGVGVRQLACTMNGVDTELFVVGNESQNEGPLRIGFSGNNNHDWRKGISEFIEPAGTLEGVELRLAMYVGELIPLDEMPKFYHEIDVYVCASASEGFSLSVLEAAASGRPVISTRVGGCEDLIIDGVNGFLVDRDVDAIREKVEFLRDNREKAREMGRMNRHIVEQLWSWKTRSRGWLSFIKSHL